MYLTSYYGEGNGIPLQCSCLENPMDGGAWWAAVHGVAKSQTRLSDLTFTFHFHALEKEMATHSSVLPWRIPGAIPQDGGAWWAAIYGVAQSRTQLSDFTFTFMHWRRKWQPTPRDGGAWWAAIYGVAQRRTRLKQLSSSSSSSSIH